MGIGGKINRPRTELRKKLFKRRRERARGRRQKRRSPSARAGPAAVWGKRLRKELKRLRGERGAPGGHRGRYRGRNRSPEPPPLSPALRAAAPGGAGDGDVEMAAAE
ncbi:uncharacterized protein C11orf98 homolog isoform X1 [Passer montanus]|uniref:uncharacterized protein C11orf98 homolog isoform X1 n=1 Tax=Passer montanus TaxID=9160 RepID=UPI0019619169|nr:uncharacterized protein C11orf98 homolog isoform X1 [Passer montanus]